ncbi:MAG TPA: GNAT family N-acetyltransferase [Candidatus Omnitrophota bacterium]|jgi:GNAT superfamily N-acetyltransferase|nr:GNAT family N-acetyltransferase [Candidatus Omnitrophota bacterium]
MVTIRRCTKEDEKAVLELITNVMSKEFQDAASAYPMEDVEQIATAYGGIGDAFFVAVDDHNKVVGTVAVKKEDERIALLRRLFVAPTHRNLRIGKKLIEHAIRFCREAGYGEMIFKTTSRMSGAIQLCMKNGFVQRAHIALGPIELLKFSLSLNPQKG